MDTFSGCFTRQPQRAAATQYVDGLFNDSERKSMEAMHGRLGDAASYQAFQHFITHSPWDANRVWAHLRTHVPTRTGVLALVFLTLRSMTCGQPCSYVASPVTTWRCCT